MDDRATMTALFAQDVQLEPLMQLLRDAGVSDEEVTIMTPLPLSEQTSARVGSVPLYLVTVIAGLLGIGVGIFFAGGTAAMYPLMTGGKPIVAPPVVGIIAYETMMLLAIAVTFVAMMAGIRYAHRAIAERDTRIDDGFISVAIILPPDAHRVSSLRALLERAGALDVGHLQPTSHKGVETGQVAAAVLAAICVMAVLSSCSRDMQEQPSYQPQEAPRLHSPVGSVPRDSRAVMAALPAGDRITAGEKLFRINCAHCHGIGGTGDGPVSRYLKEKPANLHKPEVQELPERAIDDMVTNGKDMMPPFKGELSAEERRSLAAYVKVLPQPREAVVRK